MTSDSGHEADDELSDSRRSGGSCERRPGHQHIPFDPSGWRHHTAGQRIHGLQGSDPECPGGHLCPDFHPRYGHYDHPMPEDGFSVANCIAPIRRPHARSQAKDKRLKFVWPRDQNPRHGPWGPWDRIKDLATGKGPDIWIEELHRNGPHHPVWTGWKTVGQQHPSDPRPRWKNLGFNFHDDEQISPIKSARREDGKKYDHRTRSYRLPQPNMWSDVVWDEVERSVPLYSRDENGSTWVNPKVPGGARYNMGILPNPFWGNLP